MTAAPSGFQADGTTPANDYVYGPTSWQAVDGLVERSFDWTVRADEAGDHRIGSLITAPRVSDGSDQALFDVVLSADVGVVASLPTDGPYNHDESPDTPGLSWHAAARWCTGTSSRTPVRTPRAT